MEDQRSSGGSSDSKRHLQETYIARAKLLAERDAPSNYPICASCVELGHRFGVGVALYFKVLSQLGVLFFILAVTLVPFFVVINTSVFTDATHQNDHNFGVKVYEKPHLFSFTFAAIVDTAMDNDTLQYMNTEFAGSWRGPMRKATFLTWLSLADAFGVVVLLGFITYMTLQAQRFVQSVDARTLEVSSFSVLVHGLPGDANPHEVGDHFSRFGEIVDVVLVRDMRPVLATCKQVSQLEQQRALLEDQMRLSNSAAYAQRADATEAKLESVLHRMETMSGGPTDFPVKAAFITFNQEVEARACLDNLPRGWWSARVQPQPDRLRRKHRIWVSPASSPDDYIHQNIPCPWYARFTRRTFTRVIVLVIIAATAAAITRLGSISVQENQTIAWQTDRMQQGIAQAAQQLSISTSKNSPHRNVTEQLYVMYQQATASVDWSTYCAVALPTACTPFFGSLVNADGFKMTYTQLLQWSSTTEALVKQRPLLRDMTACSQDMSTDVCAAYRTTLALSACLPCHCLGLAQVDFSTDQSVDWMSEAKAECSPYVDAWDVRSWGVRIAVALVISGINYALKMVIELLMFAQKHWTHSEREQEYALLAYFAQLLNSMLVLLLVNAAAVADATQNSEQSGWLHYLVLNGQYNDFSPAWYRDVGLSILVLIMLQAFSPLLTILTDVGWKSMQRCWVSRAENLSQTYYTKAYARPEFALAQRVADALLTVSVTLLFSSGMPILYVLAFIVVLITIFTERVALTRVCTVTSRYDKRLPGLVIGVLPWATLAHCLMGLWMHTHFKIITGDAPAASTATGGSTTTALTASQAVGQAFSRQELLNRITAANGIALLVCAGVLVLWLIIRILLWRVFRRWLTSFLRRWCCGWCIPLINGPEPGLVPFEVALLSGRLSGVATYRLPHHPAYTNMFDGMLHKAIWLRAQGHLRYTRLVSGRGGVSNLVVSREVVREMPTRDVEALLAAGSLPRSVTNLAKKLATQSRTTASGSTSSSSGGGAKPESRTGRFWPLSKSKHHPSLTHDASGQHPNRTVHIQVVADTPHMLSASQHASMDPRPSPARSNPTPRAAGGVIQQGLSHPRPDRPMTRDGMRVEDRSFRDGQKPMAAHELIHLAAPRLAELSGHSRHSMDQSVGSPRSGALRSVGEEGGHDGRRGHPEHTLHVDGVLRPAPPTGVPVMGRPRLAPRLYNPATGMMSLGGGTQQQQGDSPMHSNGGGQYPNQHHNPLHRHGLSTDHMGAGFTATHQRLMSLPTMPAVGASPRGAPGSPMGPRVQSIQTDSFLPAVVQHSPSHSRGHAAGGEDAN